MTSASGIYRDLRILELGSGAAGPVSTRYFAEQGATVVRIESAKRPDFLRLLHAPKDRDGMDAAPMFVLLNPDKKSLTLDLKRAGGVGLVKQLTRWADVVAENFSPGVMNKWGLGYDELRQVKPDLIMVSGCLFGQTGPQRSYPGFGGQGSAIAGFNHLTGHPESSAHGPYATITDSLSPRYVALCIAAALLERGRSGQGQYIDVSQIETGVYSLSETVVRYSANAEVERRRGNHSEWAAPHAVYPCLGEDRWIAIAARSDEDWRALASALGEPDWSGDPRFSTLAGRLEHQIELDHRIGEATLQRPAREWMELLQAAGVEAGLVASFEDLFQDPQLESRGHFQELDHELLGKLAFERSGFRLARSPGGYRAPGPRLGEHNREVLGEILGIAPEEIERLVAEGVVA